MKILNGFVKNCVYPLSFLVFSSSAFATGINNVVSNPLPGDPILSKIKEVGYYNGVHLSQAVSGFFGEYSFSDEIDGIVYLGAGGGQSVCGAPTDTGAIGTHVIDVSNKANPVRINTIPPKPGTTSTGALVTKLPNGDKIFVRAPGNSCAVSALLTPGQKGIEIFNVNDPMNPVLIKALNFEELNATLLSEQNALHSNLGVSLVTFFKRDGKVYLALNVGTFGRFQIWDMTDPVNPNRVFYWGTEMLHVAELGLAVTLADIPTLAGADYIKLRDYILGINPTTEAEPFSSGTPGRYVGSLSISENGKEVLIASSETGIILLDIKDFSNPKVISIAKDLTNGFAKSKSIASGDVQFTENAKVVVETNRDSSPTAFVFSIKDGPKAGTYKPVSETSWTKQIVSLPGQKMGGVGTTTKFVGTACNVSYTVPPADNTTQIAVAVRGQCAFTAKATNIQTAGYAGFVMMNNRLSANAESALGMAGTADPNRDLPGIGVTYATGLMILGLDPNTNPKADPATLFNVFNSSSPAANTEADLKLTLINTPTLGAAVEAAAIYTGWGQVRIWDYKDHTKPVLASTFDTLCSSNAYQTLPSSSCPTLGQRGGAYEPYKPRVIGTTAYVSWGQEGIIMLDVKDPYNPKEVGRFGNAQASGGVNGIFGIRKDKVDDCIYAVDEALGMYILSDTNSACKK